MDDRKTAIRIVANLGQRVRRARRELKRIHRDVQMMSAHTVFDLDLARARENEAWNAFQASKALLNQTLGEEA